MEEEKDDGPTTGVDLPILLLEDNTSLPVSRMAIAASTSGGGTRGLLLSSFGVRRIGGGTGALLLLSRFVRLNNFDDIEYTDTVY